MTPLEEAFIRGAALGLASVLLPPLFQAIYKLWSTITRKETLHGT